MSDKVKKYVYELTEVKDAIGKVVNCVWIEKKSRTIEEWEKLAKAWKGFEMGEVLETEMTNYKRRPKFHRQIVTNLRQSQPNLAQYSDDQIYNAYDDFYFSVDQTDESLVVNYITDE